MEERYRADTHQFFLGAVFEGIREEILVMDSDFVIMDANSAFLKNTGLAKEQVIGRRCYEVKESIGKPCRMRIGSCPLELARKAGKMIEATYLNESPQGELRETYLLVYPLKGKKEGSEYFIEIARDVTEFSNLKRRLRQSERFAAVGQAVAHVAHELRNPMMVIGGFAGQLRRGLKDPKDLVKMDIILGEVRRLEELIAGIGDFTRTYRLVRSRTDLRDIIRDAAKSVAEVYSQSRYAFQDEYSRRPVEVYCDPDKMKQVFLNILANGCEAMPDGGTITISAKALAPWTEIRVKDEGAGIPKEKIQRVFEPFFSTKEKGLGLGLAICYKIIQAHEGEIFAESELGQGTSFIIRVPVSGGEE